MIKPSYLLFVSEEEYAKVQEGLNSLIDKYQWQGETDQEAINLSAKLQRTYAEQKRQIAAMEEYRGNTAELPEVEL